MGPRRDTTLSGRRVGLPFKDDLPAVSSSRMRATGAIAPDSTTVIVRFGDVAREVGVVHTRFPKGGSWSFFVCPKCDRPARTLRLYDGQVVCRRCDGLLYRCEVRDPTNRLERLRQALYGSNKPQRRKRLETAYRRALLAERRKWL